MGAASLSNQNLIHVSDGFAVNLKNHVHLPLRGRLKKVTWGGDFFESVVMRGLISGHDFSRCDFLDGGVDDDLGLGPSDGSSLGSSRR